MKISHIGIIAFIICAVGYIAYKIGKDGNPLALQFALKDTTFVDSVPEGHYYKSKVYYNSGSSNLGVNPLVNHQVPTDYNGYNNNWDDDLNHIK